MDCIMLQLASKDCFLLVLDSEVLHTIHGKDTVLAFAFVISVSLMFSIHRSHKSIRKTFWSTIWSAIPGIETQNSNYFQIKKK